MVIYYVVLKKFSIIGAILALYAVWLLNTAVRIVYYRLMIFRYFIFDRTLKFKCMKGLRLDEVAKFV